MNKRNHDKFMTDKEKDYVSFSLRKNIKQAQRYKNFTPFFTEYLFFSNKRYNLSNEERMLGELKLNSKEKNENSNLISNKDKIDDSRIEIMKQEAEARKLKLQEIFKNNLGRTVKKSKKTPRVIFVEEPRRLDENILTKLKIENLHAKIIRKIYNIDKRKPRDDNEDIDGNECEVSDEETISDLDFIDFIRFKKFYKLLSMLFDVYRDDSNIKYDLTIRLLKYSTHIKHEKEFSSFVNTSFNSFADVTEADLLECNFFDNFYYNICNVILATGLLIEKDYLNKIFYTHICDENLELIFTLNDYKIIWQFLAVLVRGLNDEEKGHMIALLKDKIVECIVSIDNKSISGLNLFLDAIGIEKKDINFVKN